MTFKLKIELGNAAMQDHEDVAEALERVARVVRQGVAGRRIMDLNGNAVGEWSFSGSAAGMRSRHGRTS